MSIFSRKEPPKPPPPPPKREAPVSEPEVVAEKAHPPAHFQPLQAGAPDVSNDRHVRRLETLFLWFEQKGATATAEKVESMQAEISRRAHILAGKGYPFVESREALHREFSEWLR